MWFKQKIKKTINKISTKMLRVIKNEHISNNMLRITLEGEALNENFNWSPGCYVKLQVPDIENGRAVDNGKLKRRTYTVRKHIPVKQSIEIDFAVHQPAGPATSWALNAKIGDEVMLSGPGRLKINPTIGDWYIFSADMAAMPAAVSVMESLKRDAKGYAFLEITNEADKQNLEIPEGIQVSWLVHSNPKTKSAQQLNALKTVKPLDGKPNIFVAGELSTIREIKSYINTSSSFFTAEKYISSYWKIGLKEEEHKMAKRMAL